MTYRLQNPQQTHDTFAIPQEEEYSTYPSVRVVENDRHLPDSRGKVRHNLLSGLGGHTSTGHYDDVRSWREGGHGC
jgi:hypothetical protein